MFEKAKNLLDRLRGGKVKRKPKDFLQTLKATQPFLNEEVGNRIEENNFPANAINIKNVEDRQNIFNKLNDLQRFDDFVNNFPLQWLKVRLDRVRGDLEKFQQPTGFDDEDLNFNFAKKVRGVAEKMLEIYQNCNNSTELDDLTKQNLIGIVEDYLKNLGIEQKNFSVGDSFDDWASLAMQNSFTIQTTNERHLHNTIKNIEIQPRVIYYVNDVQEVDKFIFGGLCVAYRFEEG